MQALIDHVSKPAAAAVAAASRAAIPAWVDALVLACLEKDPDKRPGDADDILRRIDEHDTNATWTTLRAREWWQANVPVETDEGAS